MIKHGGNVYSKFTKKKATVFDKESFRRPSNKKLNLNSLK